jgi:hypothetical protein
MSRESSDKSVCEEIALDTEEPEVSDSSTAWVDLPETLDEAGDETAPTYADEEDK